MDEQINLNNARVSGKILVNGKVVFDERGAKNMVLLHTKQVELEDGEEANSLTTMMFGNEDDMHNLAVEFLAMLRERNMLTSALYCLLNGAHHRTPSGEQRSYHVEAQVPISKDDLLDMAKQMRNRAKNN